MPAVRSDLNGCLLNCLYDIMYQEYNVICILPNAWYGTCIHVCWIKFVWVCINHCVTPTTETQACDKINRLVQYNPYSELPKTSLCEMVNVWFEKYGVIFVLQIKWGLRIIEADRPRNIWHKGAVGWRVLFLEMKVGCHETHFGSFPSVATTGVVFICFPGLLI